MQKPFYNDILLVLILTVLSVACLFVTDFNLFSITTPLIYIPYALILLFLPGYSMLAAENLQFIHKSLFKRVGLSIFVSLVISVFLALLLTYTPLKILDGVIFYILGAFTFMLSVIAICKRKKSHYVHFVEPEGQPGFDSEILNFKLGESTTTPQLGVERIEKPTKVFDDDNLKAFPHEVQTRAMNVENQEIKMDINLEPKKPDENSKTPPLRNLEPEQAEEQPKNSKPDQQTKTPQPGNPDKRPNNKPPRRFTYLDLVVVLLLTIICAIFVLEPILNQSIFNSAPGLFLMLFLPGYALIAAIYPKKDDLSSAARLVLSFGVSYFLTSVIGLALNYTQWGNSLNPILLVLTVFTLFSIGTAFLTRIRSQKADRFQVKSSGSKTPSSTSDSPHTTTRTPSFMSSSRNRNILMVGVVVVIALLIAAPAAYNFMIPAKDVNASTQFYVLGPDGKNISTYPNNLTSGDNATVTIVLENHENAETTFRIVTTSNQTVINEIDVTLKPGERREIPYNFTVGEPGTKKMEFFLYKLPNLNDIFRTYGFWVNILGMVNETEGDETSTDTTQTTTPTYQEPSYQPPVYQPPVYQPPANEEPE
ncbi:MAG TPA: DUF1616 domain-containing protein, partial [Methanobacterium sp.]